MNFKILLPAPQVIDAAEPPQAPASAETLTETTAPAAATPEAETHPPRKAGETQTG